EWLMSPPITIPAGPSASLQFQHYYEIETGYDRGYVEISSDGGTSWTSLGNYFTGMSTGWVRSTYDLAAYTGRTVKVRFRLTTDFIVPWLGWYIDDVQVTNRPAITNDRAWIPTKLPTKLDVKPLYNGAKPGTYKLAIPGTGSRRYGIASLPADATVTILETNRSVHTDPATGDYSLVHAAGTYTARAEAYGYFPVDAAVTIPEGGVVSANFLLEPIPPGLLTGIVTNAQTGAQVAGARVKLLEDSHIAPVTTGADGRYSFVALPGTYTLNVSRQEYRSYTANAAVIGNLTTEHNVALEPFVAVPGELAYDDGTAESAWVSNDAGNGFGVRMTPDASRGAAVLKNASFYVWDTSWPTPGGTSYSVAVYDSSGPGGVPGQRVAGPIPATAVRGTWNTVDLSSLGLTFTNDFYVAYIFTTSYPNSPGLGSDMSQPYYDRSWQLGGGAWYKAPSDRGNWMIRATVMYEVQPPAITSPAPDSITNQTQLDVRGTSVDGATITVYNDGVAAGTGTAADGAFNVPVTLHRGTNRLTATATLPAGTTQPSADVIVTLDDIGPVLTVSSPADQSVTTREVATVTGSASDERLAGVTVNGEAAVLTNGSFSHRVLLDPGDNLLTIVASDTAGNSTTVTRHVFSDTTGPAITNVMPATDTTIRPGRPVIIAFDAEAGLTRVGYIINVATGWDGPTVSTGELTNMRETRPGHYEGTYSPPYGTSFRGAEITVWAIDSAGNRSEAVAPGKLNVISPNQPPVVRITLPSSVRANTPVTFTNTSYDPDGTISQWRWSFSDGTAATGSTVTKRFTRPGTYKVTLTATDNTGAVTTGTATVVVR
ncbi:MAG TPA: PKD domain-containing protein, partial [Symbiobacteriaceae bacterium]|nr:PKD domain-containing protein [Symbiobacteriaceae bacterium]